MKKKLSVLVAVLVAVGGTAYGATGNISIYSSYSPNDTVRASFDPFNTKVQAFLRQGQAPGSLSDNPVDFWLATGFNWRRATVSSTASLWNAILNPTQYGEQRGGRVVFPFHIVSPTAFVPSEVKMEIHSNDPYTGHPLGSLGFVPTLTSWAPEAVGLWYGADGVKGTADDEIRVAGVLPVNELWYTGPGIGFTANNQSELDVISSYMSAVGTNFAVFITVSLARADGTVMLAPVTHRAGDNNVVFPLRIVQSSDKKSWMVAPENRGLYFVQESTNLQTWVTRTTRVTGGEKIADVATAGNRYFRLRQ